VHFKDEEALHTLAWGIPIKFDQGFHLAQQLQAKYQEPMGSGHRRPHPFNDIERGEDAFVISTIHSLV
jgi:hypothetical protein